MLPFLLAALAAPQVPPVQLRLEVEVASAAVSPEGAFGSVADVAADRAGNVYVVDNLAGRVHAYTTPSGRLLRTFGRREELNRPVRVEARDSVVTVLNPGGTAVSYTLGGGLLESRRVPFGSQRATRLGEDRFVVTSWGGVARDRPLPIESLILVRQAREDTLLTAPSADVLFQSPAGRLAMPSFLCRPVHFVMGPGEELWVATGADGRLTEWTGVTSRPVAGRSVQVAPPGQPLPDSVRASLMGELPRQVDPTTGDLYLPSVESAICGLEIEPDGELWVRGRDVAGAEHWQAIDPVTLRSTRVFTAPEGVSIRAFAAGRAFGVRLDEDDFPSLMIYRIE